MFVRIVTPKSLTNSFLNLQIWKFKRSNIRDTGYKPRLENVKPWAGFRDITRRYFMYLILAQDHLHNFNLAHQIQRKINTLEKEKTLFETHIKLCNVRFEKKKIWEGVASLKKSHNERLLFKILGERALVNNFLVYLYTAIILCYFILKNLRWKRKNI